MTNYYICDNCHFQFERLGDCLNCPDCGKYRIRYATDEEIENYIKIKADMD